MNSKDYELLVREIYQQILSQDQAANIVVQHNVKKQGNATSHQIDVYWEFSLGGVTHKVIVQAKNWKNPIRKGDVLTFKGVLEDLPGTVGIMVTTSDYQKGAFEVAGAAGIIICQLREEVVMDSCFYPGETATFTMKGLLKTPAGDHLGMTADLARKIPTVSELVFKADSEWHKANAPLPDSFASAYSADSVQFYDEDGKESVTLKKILGGFYAEMHRDGKMSARKTHRFEKPTFLRLPSPPITIKEESVSATILFTPTVKEVIFKAKDVAVFILRNLVDGAEHRFFVKQS